MEEKTAGVVELEVDGLDRIQALIDDLTEHLRAVQEIIDALSTVELDIRAVTPSRGTPNRS